LAARAAHRASARSASRAGRADALAAGRTRRRPRCAGASLRPRARPDRCGRDLPGRTASRAGATGPEAADARAGADETAFGLLVVEEDGPNALEIPVLEPFRPSPTTTCCSRRL